MIHTVSITVTTCHTNRDNLSHLDDTHGINFAVYDVTEGGRVAPLGDAGAATIYRRSLFLYIDNFIFFDVVYLGNR